MGIRRYKPTSAGRRNASVCDFKELTKGAKPEKSLLRPNPRRADETTRARLRSVIAAAATNNVTE